MSSRPEDEEEFIEDEDEEVEEGEIVEDEDLEFNEDEDYFPDEEEIEGMDLAGLMSSLLATPDGDTVCSALVNLCHQMETQNRILIKMLARMQPPKSA